MAGHSKWSKVKRSKGLFDVKRGAALSKLVKEITVATRMGTGDYASGTPRLRSLVDMARAANMPEENVERAVKKGTGELEGVHYEETIYEGYAPGGVALVIEAATDNKNRTAADLRLIFSKNGGSLAASGSVLYQFDKKGQITVPLSLTHEDQILARTLDVGTGVLSTEDTHDVVFTPPDRPYAVADALRNGGIATETQKLTCVPDNIVALTDESDGDPGAQAPRSV